MFSPYESSLRVPFLIRWPGKIPPKQVSNETVHQIDLFPTLANIVGADLPKDRIMDGVDQSDFLMGKVEKSASGRKWPARKFNGPGITWPGPIQTGRLLRFIARTWLLPTRYCKGAAVCK